jgi:hypothetical protein
MVTATELRDTVHKNLEIQLYGEAKILGKERFSF